MSHNIMKSPPLMQSTAGLSEPRPEHCLKGMIAQGHDRACATEEEAGPESPHRVCWGWHWSHSSRQQWEWKPERGILRTQPMSPASGSESRPTAAKPNRPWDCTLSWQQMDMNVCPQSEVWSRSLSNPQKCFLLPACITTVLSGSNQEYQTFIQTLGATLELHWNYTNVTEIRVWQWVNKPRNSSISWKGDKGICHDQWCDS